MAYAFTTSPQANITGTYTSHNGLQQFTMVGWMRRPSASTHQGFGFNNNNDAFHRTHFVHFSDNTMYFVIANGANANGSSSQNITGWNHWAMVFDGSQSTNATRLLGYANGASQALTFNGTIPATISSNANNNLLQIGRNTPNSVFTNGDIAEVAAYDVALAPSEVSALSKGFQPSNIRTGNLLWYIPLLRNLLDVVSGTTLTNSNATVANHPRVYA
jgi:hypothetical protein